MLRAIIALVLVLAGVVGSYLKSKQPADPSETSTTRPMPTVVTLRGAVTHVADGDTIEVDLDGDGPDRPTRIRLLGIDTPELTGPTSKLGEASWRYTKSLVDGKPVTLQHDGLKPEYDKYQRLLAYVVLPDGMMLNERLIRDGHAFAHRFLTCGRTASFVKAEDEAKADRRGFWQAMRTELMPDWRQRWLAEGSPARR